MTDAQTTDRRMGDRMSGEDILLLLGALLLQLAGLGLLVFWAMGAVLLLGGNGDQINAFEWGGLPRLAYLAYPLVLGGASLLGWFLFWRKQGLLANLVLSAPVGLMALLYLYLIVR